MRILFSLVFVVLVLVGHAQIPQKINYQGAVRDAGGAPVANKSINVQFDILQGSANGSQVFTETQNGIVTSSLGLFATQIGAVNPLSGINWQTGPYFLRVSVDPNGGGTFMNLGTQELAAVPFALATPAPVLTYSSSVLTVNGSTVAIAQGTPVTLSAGSNVQVAGGPDYTITSTPTLSIANGSLAISNGNSVVLPSASIVGTGLAQTTPTTGTSFTVDVPVPTYNQNSGVLNFGATPVNVYPALSINGGTLQAGPPSNTVIVPASVTVMGGGIATAAGGPSYTITVPQPTLNYNASTNVLGISPGNNVTIPQPPPVQITQGGLANVTPVGQNSFNVTVPVPVYTGANGVLAFGTTSVNVVPTMSISGTTISLAQPSNSVDIAPAFPWVQGVGTLTMATGANRVGLGASASNPAAKLDVQGENTLVVPVVKVNNSNASNSSAALDVASSGNLALNATNNSAGGVAGNFTSAQGIAITASNSSSFYALQATNSNTLGTSYSAYFDGGLVAKGKGGATNFVMSARNSSVDVMVVRNDGRVGIGTNTPAQQLDVAGSVKITDGTEAAGRMLASDAFGNASWQPVSLLTTSSFGTRSIASVGTTSLNFTSLGTFSKVYADSKVEVIVQTHVVVYDLNGLNSVLFEVNLGGNVPLNNTGRVNYFKDNNAPSPLIASKTDFMPVTIIAEFGAGLAPGTYNVNLSAIGQGGAGTADTVVLDPGNYGASSITIKEYR